jgi:hypothetical protein
MIVRMTCKVLAATAVAGLSLLPLAARADVYCPVRSSIFGTVASVRPYQLTLQTTGDLGYIHVRLDRPRTNTHGLPLRRGIFAGIYGCLEPGGQRFDAEEVTLAPSAAVYAGYAHRTYTLSGRIIGRESGRVLLQTQSEHGKVWLETDRRDLRVGEMVTAYGHFDPRDGDFEVSGIGPER